MCMGPGGNWDSQFLHGPGLELGFPVPTLAHIHGSLGSIAFWLNPICLDWNDDLTLGRLGGGWVPPPWRFFPVTSLMIPIAKIASSYLLPGMGDTFWHMWHHLDAVTWHMSWRQMSMTVAKKHCFYHCLLIEISFYVDVIKQQGWCCFQLNWGHRIKKCYNKSRDLDGWLRNLRSNFFQLGHS